MQSSLRHGCPDFQKTALERREFLRVGGLSLLGLGLADVLRAQAASHAAPKAKSVLFFQHYGAPSHVDMWDMKPNAPVEIRGEFKPISTSVPGYFVCEHMPRIAKLVDRLAVVRNMSHHISNHNPATYLALTGRTSTSDIVQVGAGPNDWPNPGSILSKLLPGDGKLPDSVILPHLTFDQVYTTPGQFGGILGKRYDPFIIARDPSRADFALEELSLPADVTFDRLGDRRKLLEVVDRHERRQDHALAGMDAFYHQAWSLLTSPDVKKALDLSAESPTVRERYGMNIVGQSLLLSRRLLEAGVRFVTCYHGLNPGDLSGWDTHTGNFPGLKERLLPPEDVGFSALIEDMDERGLLEDTLVVWSGEFGRSPRIGKPAVTTRIDPSGRDHWPYAYSIAYAGAGVKKGYIHGETDSMGAFPRGASHAPADVTATILWALGIHPETSIPGVTDPLGRPFVLCDGKPIADCFV